MWRSPTKVPTVEQQIYSLHLQALKKCMCFSESYNSGGSQLPCLSKQTGTKPNRPAKYMHCLGEYHAHDMHTWEGGYCDFHPLKQCSFMICGEGDVKVQHTRLSLGMC